MSDLHPTGEIPVTQNRREGSFVMKTHALSLMCLAAISLFVIMVAQMATAQDAAKVSPGMVKVLLENDNVWVLARFTSSREKPLEDTPILPASSTFSPIAG
jgi:hypothetical protein